MLFWEDGLQWCQHGFRLDREWDIKHESVNFTIWDNKIPLQIPKYQKLYKLYVYVGRSRMVQQAKWHTWQFKNIPELQVVNEYSQESTVDWFMRIQWKQERFLPFDSEWKWHHWESVFHWSLAQGCLPLTPDPYIKRYSFVLLL